jgi:transposase InsO family protein
MPNCTEEIGTSKIGFGQLGRRVVEGRFDGGSMTSDGGGMLLGATDRKLGLMQAAARCIAEPGLIFHSDRGSQYCSHEFQDALKDYEMKSSMSRKANYWDNAPTESLWGRLKVDGCTAGCLPPGARPWTR